MTALWRNFEKHHEAQQEASNMAAQARILVLERQVTENNALLKTRDEEIVLKNLAASRMQSRISELEQEVVNQRVLLQNRDNDIASKDSAISKGRSTILRIERELRAANEQCTHLVSSLSIELNARDSLEIRLRAITTECSEDCKNAASAEAEKEKLTAEVEKLEAAKSKALKAQDHAESLLIRIRERYDANQEKIKRVLKQLSYVPYIRDFGFGRGFNWGFENFRALVLEPPPGFDPRTVQYVPSRIPEDAVRELSGFGQSFMPDVPD
jgi:chromosome segregation ATPase